MRKIRSIESYKKGETGSILKKYNRLSNMTAYVQSDRTYKTIAIDLSMSIQFKEHPDIKSLKPKDSIDFISATIDQIKSNLWNEVKVFLDPTYFPISLHRDAIIISNDIRYDEEKKNASAYYYGKITKQGLVTLNLGLYVHTSNAIKDKKDELLEFVYFEDATKQNPQTQNVEDFIYHISSSSTLNNSDLFSVTKNNYTPRGKNKTEKEVF